MDNIRNHPVRNSSPYSFVSVLDRLSQTPELADHRLGDGQQQIAYSLFPEYFRKIDELLISHELSRNDCIAFECRNTAASLIVLLALLYRGQHVLLLPAQGAVLKEPGYKPVVPAFCKVGISVDRFETGNELTPESIAGVINIVAHERFSLLAWKRLDLTKRRLMLRTSGSMGDAKIVMFSHEHMLGNAYNCVQRFALQADLRISIVVPVFHMYGLGAAFFPALMAGASIEVQADTNILRFMEHERRFQPDVLYLNSVLCAMLLKFRRSTQPFLRTISAGEPIPASLFHDYRERFGHLINLYGSTEMGAAATACADAKERDHTRLFPMQGVRFEIDPADNSLYCLNSHGFDGYVNSQGLALPAETCPYNTGDLASQLDDGCFEFMDRKNNSINRAGFLVQFNDIEEALHRLDDVERALVLSGPEQTLRGQKLYAFCVPASADANAQDVRGRCADHLPKYAVPDEIILLESFPLLANGKVDRQYLKKQISNTCEESQT